MNPAFAIAEIVWILMGRHDAAFLGYWNKRVQKFTDDTPNLYGAYGYRLRTHFGFDQIARGYSVLHENPKTRQVVLQIWDARSDLPAQDGQPRSEDIPCNVVSLLKVRDGQLEWMQILRSNDVFLGIPHNFVQFTYLQEILAGWLGLRVGTYNQISDSLHVYDSDREKIESSLPIEVDANSDDIALPKELSEKCFAELSHRIDDFISEELNESAHMKAAKWREAPRPFQNLLLLLAGEAARKRGWISLSYDIMALNTNRALVQLWQRWLDRLNHKV
jgi:thymidylate synthase